MPDDDYMKEIYSLEYELSQNMERTCCYPIEDYIYSFSSVMPQIEFDPNVSLKDTLIDYFEPITYQSHAYGAIRCPGKMLYMLKYPDDISFIGSFLAHTLRHQYSIYTQTYYWIIFIIEMLNRYDDAINPNHNSPIPLDCQLYYEYYVLDALISFYSRGLAPSMYYNETASTNMKNNDILNMHIKYITKKIIQLVEEHLIRIKPILIEKCKKNEITPVRAMWLYACPMTVQEMRSILHCTTNKYIRTSLLWVSGFQQLHEIKSMSANNLEDRAYVFGYNVKHNHLHRYNRKNDSTPYYKTDFLENKITEEYTEEAEELKCFYECKFFRHYHMEKNIIPKQGWDGVNKELEDTLSDWDAEHYQSRLKLFQMLNCRKEMVKQSLNLSNEKNDPPVHKKGLMSIYPFYCFFHKLELNKKNDPLVQVNNHSKRVLLSFHPFYCFSYRMENWGLIFWTEYTNTANEYKSYYKDHTAKTHYYISPDEQNTGDYGYFFLDDNTVYVVE